MQGTGPFHLMAKLEQIMHHPHIVIAVISFVQVNGQCKYMHIYSLGQDTRKHQRLHRPCICLGAPKILAQAFF